MVRVKLFANFREIVGEKELLIEAENLESLLKILSERYSGFRDLLSYAIIMVNGKRVEDMEADLSDDDVVAIFPPVSGGWNAF